MKTYGSMTRSTTTAKRTRVKSLTMTCLLGLGAHLAISKSAAAQTPRAAGSPPLMDRQKEVALALSACPAPVANKAGAYVLERSGYVKVRESQNGFIAIVQHALPTSQEPQCMDAEGTRTHLPRILKVAEWRAEGKSREEIKRLVADAFARGTFRVPTRPGIDYMLSTENVVAVDEEVSAPFPPHLMFYAPYLTNADIGSDGSPKGSVFIPNEGTPHALIIVPVATPMGSAHTSADEATARSSNTPNKPESKAVAVARAHIEAWSHHDFETARKSLARDVHVTATTTLSAMAPTDLTGIDNYMEGLRKFAQAVVPGTAQVIESIGDERNALVMLTVKAAFGPGAPEMTLPAARLYALDEEGKIKIEQVIFYAAPATAATARSLTAANLNGGSHE